MIYYIPYGCSFCFFHIIETTTPGLIKNQVLTMNTTVSNLPTSNAVSTLPSSQHKSKHGDCTVLMYQAELPSKCFPAHSYKWFKCFLLLTIKQGNNLATLTEFLTYSLSTATTVWVPMKIKIKLSHRLLNHLSSRGKSVSKTHNSDKIRAFSQISNSLRYNVKKCNTEKIEMQAENILRK